MPQKGGALALVSRVPVLLSVAAVVPAAPELAGEDAWREGEEDWETVLETSVKFKGEMLGVGERVGLSELLWDVMVLGESVTVGQVLAEGVL